MNQLINRVETLFDRIPASLIALCARVGIGSTFWLSGQTKIEGLVLDPIGLQVSFGWPHVSEGALELFRSEYALPLLPPELAANMAAFSEHLFPLMLVFGLGTRFAALALLGMTAVIEVFVYPDAWPTHAVWAACLLYLVARGAGALSLDHLLARRTR
jgi:putative oxidoreductase